MKSFNIELDAGSDTRNVITIQRRCIDFRNDAVLRNQAWKGAVILCPSAGRDEQIGSRKVLVDVFVDGKGRKVVVQAQYCILAGQGSERNTAAPRGQGYRQKQQAFP